MIRVTDVRLNLQARANVQAVLDSGDLSAGRFVAELERLVAERAGAPYAVAVSNATAGLYLALVAAGVTDGSRVALPAFTFAGTANAVLMAGGVPVWCDVDHTWLMDVEQALASDVDVVMPVHLYGQRVNLAPLAGRRVVEDAAQAIGAPVVFGVFSLYGSKTVPAGEGGVVVTHDKQAADWIRAAANHGMRRRYEHLFPGFNFRMTDLQAAVAVGQLADLDRILNARAANAGLLWKSLADLPVGLPQPYDNVWHQFTISVDNRDAVAAHLAAAGIETRVHYPQALPDLDWLPDADVPNARRAAASVLSLPVHEHLTAEQVGLVAATTREAVERCLV